MYPFTNIYTATRARNYYIRQHKPFKFVAETSNQVETTKDEKIKDPTKIEHDNKIEQVDKVDKLTNNELETKTLINKK